MKYLKPYFIFCARVTTLAWRVSSPKNLSVLAAVIISALALIACPILLGYGVQRTLENLEAWRQNLAVLVVLYSILWLIGQSFRYLFYPAYGFIEQKMQSRHMADALATSIGADPRARAMLGASEIAYAVDAQAASIRETLATLYLSILPAGVGCIAGAVSILVMGGVLELGIFCGFVALYLAGSMPLIARHQKFQGEFFDGSMRSFGTLENTLRLWCESRILGAAPFLRDRYAQGRLPVEAKALKSYRYTMLLHTWQGAMLALCLLAIVLKTVLFGEGSPAQITGTAVALIGVCAAAIGPLQAVGFGVSTIAVSAERYRQAHHKILAPAADDSGYLIDYVVTTGELSLRVDARNLSETSYGVYTVKPGRPCWVRGASGAGKSLLLERFLGVRATTIPAYMSMSAPQGTLRFVYLPQEAGLLVGTAHENVAFGRDIPVHICDRYLQAVGLSEFTSSGARCHDAVAGESGSVSGGEGRRIALARTLAAAETSNEQKALSPATVMVLDEPTAGLDAPTRARVWELIERAAHTAIVLVSTHDEDAPARQDDTVIEL